MNSRPKISVIVPVYNVEKYLDNCINSIVNQTYDNLEILLVDDGSKDNSGSLCDEWALRDNRIKVIHKQNGGASSARNAGLDAATGEYIGFVDADDYIDIDMYEIMYAEICTMLTPLPAVWYGRAKTAIRKSGAVQTALLSVSIHCHGLKPSARLTVSCLFIPVISFTAPKY